MIVLAIDTATPAVTAGVVELATDGPTVLATRVARDARKHAELLMPSVVAACTEAGLLLGGLDAIVTGTGPGPFTGLRVGMVTAAALGDALDIPVHGVCSLDAIALEVAAGGNAVVVTDARRREVYWAAYDAAARRISGPHVEAPAALAERLDGLGAVAVAGGAAAGLGLPVRGPDSPTPAGLVAAAAEALRSRAAPGPLEPLYLRRPDAVAPGARKRVTTP